MALGFSTLCAFTHQPSHFVKLGFTIVPHVVPEKIAHDCTACPCFVAAANMQSRFRCGTAFTFDPNSRRPSSMEAVRLPHRGECRETSARSCPGICRR